MVLDGGPKRRPFRPWWGHWYGLVLRPGPCSLSLWWPLVLVLGGSWWWSLVVDLGSGPGTSWWSFVLVLGGPLWWSLVLVLVGPWGPCPWSLGGGPWAGH